MPGHQPAHPRRAAASSRSRGDPREAELPGDAAAGRVLADREGRVAPADHRRDARVRPRVAPLRAHAPARALALVEGQFVPAGFVAPLALATEQFELEPLGPQHNEPDYEAWSSSVEHIRRTPGWET